MRSTTLHALACFFGLTASAAALSSCTNSAAGKPGGPGAAAETVNPKTAEPRAPQLTTPIAPPPSATPTDIRTLQTEQHLAEILAAELTPVFAASGASPEEITRVNTVILPTIARERWRTEFAPADWTAANKLRSPRITPLAEWMTLRMRIGQSTTFDQGELLPLSSFTPDQLPEQPFLRLLVVLRQDYSGTGNNRLLPDDPKGTLSGKPNGLVARSAGRQTVPDAERIERFAPVIESAVASAAASAPDRAQLVGLLLERAFNADLDAPVYLATARRYAARADADPWLKDYFLGLAALANAFKVRGSDYVGKLSESERLGFQRGVDEAFQPLRRAHELNPHRPYPATALILLSTGSRDPAHLTPTYWFEHAVKADPQAAEPYRKLWFSTLTRWGGAPSDRAALLARTAEAEDGSTAIGAVAFGAMAEYLSDDPSEANSPVFLNLSHAALSKYLNCPNPGMNPDEAMSLALALDRKADKPDAARAILETPGWKYREPTMEGWRFAFDETRHWVYDQSEQFGPALRRINRALATGNSDEARSMSQALLAQPSLPPFVRAQATMAVSTADAVIRYAAGTPLNLLSPEGSVFWLPINAPTATIDTHQGVISVEKGPPGSRDNQQFIQCMVPLGGRYELTMEFKAQSKFGAPTGSVVVQCNAQSPQGPRTGACSTVTLTQSGAVALPSIRGMSPPTSLTVDLAQPRQIRLDVQDHLIHVYVDGSLVDVSDPNNTAMGQFAKPDSWLVLVPRPGLYAGDSVEIRNVRVVKKEAPLPDIKQLPVPAKK